MSIILKGVNVNSRYTVESVTIRINYKEGLEEKMMLPTDHLIQIPTPHGRLIEDSAVVENILNRTLMLELIDTLIDAFAKALACAPTILEAEE